MSESRLLKGAHIGGYFSADAVRKLNLDVVHPTAPYHETIPRGGLMPIADIPVLWQASVAGFPNFAYTAEHIKSVLRQPGFNGWWILGNEQDLGFGKTPPATPLEYVKSIVQNMLVILPLAPAPRRFILSLGSKQGFDAGWAEQVLNEFQREAPGILALFDAFATNYYKRPLQARECIKWLRNVYWMLERLELANRKVWLKEVGMGLPGQRDEDAALFIGRFLGLIRIMQARGDFGWLELVEWFAATDLSTYGMPYVTLIDGEKLTPAGVAWANG